MEYTQKQRFLVRQTSADSRKLLCKEGEICSQPKEPQTRCLRTFAVKSCAGSIIAREPEIHFGQSTVEKGGSWWEGSLGSCARPVSPFESLADLFDISSFLACREYCTMVKCRALSRRVTRSWEE